MRKFTFVLMMMAYAGFTMAQTIENFESLKMNLMKADPPVVDLSYFQVMANPDTAGTANINKSGTVCKLFRDKDGVPWEGFYAPLSTPIDMVNNHYIHAKVWKPRISPVKVKIQTGTGAELEIASINPQTVINGWEEVVFDMSTVSGTYNQFNFMPDVLDPVGLTEDITVYFDDFYINNNPAVGSAPVQVIENFEIIPMHPYNEMGTFTITPNPDKSGIDLSAYCIDFFRPTTAPDWAGFYSLLAANHFDSVDVTTNKYVHVKLWKPRISTVKFKLEGGTAGTLEIASMNAQTKTNAWEDFVFDFTTKTGKYPIIGFSPDAGPFTEDNHIYFDDFLVNNDPTPIAPTEQKISINMNGSPLVAGDHLYITGSFGGVYGTWNTPGDNANNELFDLDGDGIYSIYMHLSDGAYTLKFAKNAGWGTQDPLNQDRPLTIAGNANAIFTWGIAGFEVSTRENPLAGKIQMYPNPVRNELTVNSTADIRKVIITNTLGKVVGNFNYSSNQNINTSVLSKGMYFITFIGRDGNKVTQKLIKD